MATATTNMIGMAATGGRIARKVTVMGMKPANTAMVTGAATIETATAIFTAGTVRTTLIFPLDSPSVIACLLDSSGS